MDTTVTRIKTVPEIQEQVPLFLASITICDFFPMVTLPGEYPITLTALISDFIVHILLSHCADTGDDCDTARNHKVKTKRPDFVRNSFMVNNYTMKLPFRFKDGLTPAGDFLSTYLSIKSLNTIIAPERLFTSSLK